MDQLLPAELFSGALRALLGRRAAAKPTIIYSYKNKTLLLRLKADASGAFLNHEPDISREYQLARL